MKVEKIAHQGKVWKTAVQKISVTCAWILGQQFRPNVNAAYS